MATIIAMRPATVEDLAGVLNLPLSRVRAVVRRHRIEPAVRVGRRAFYGPREIRRIHALAGDGDRRPTPAVARPSAWSGCRDRSDSRGRRAGPIATFPT